MKKAILLLCALVALILSSSVFADETLNKLTRRCIENNHRDYGSVRSCVNDRVSPNPSDVDFNDAVRATCQDAYTKSELDELGFTAGDVRRCISWAKETHYEEERPHRHHRHHGHHYGYGPGFGWGWGYPWGYAGWRRHGYGWGGYWW